jgi:tetrahydromethanopterin S-methyltransferase subunit B
MAILISSRMNVVLDEDYRLVGEARSDVAYLNLSPLSKIVDELDLLSRELLLSLDPKSSPLISSRPGRGGLYRNAGLLSNIALGFLIGSLIFSLIILFISLRG